MWCALMQISNISCSSVQGDCVLHSGQKAAQLENTSDSGWMLGRALKKEFVSRQREEALELLAVHNQWSLGRAHVHIDFVSLLYHPV